VLAIVYCLGSAAYGLVREKNSANFMFGALVWRIAASIVLFLVILLSYDLGWIKPKPAKFLLRLEAAHQSFARSHNHTGQTEDHNDWNAFS
jgi:hypothetical protein